MTVQYELPTFDELRDLSAEREYAISIYLPSAPTAKDREATRRALKSSVDQAVRKLAPGHADEQRIRASWLEIDQDTELWRSLATSLALFIGPDGHREFVLPTQFDPQVHAAHWFDLGQLTRSFAADQHAYALTLSIDGWQLWSATPESRAEPIEIDDAAAIKDAATATNRDALPDRGFERDDFKALGGDEGRKLILETYAKRVGDLVSGTLRALDPTGEVPLFVFAAEPLRSLVPFDDERRTVVRIPGAANSATAPKIDAVIREHLPQINADRISAQVDRIGNDFSRGLVASDIAEIGYAATAGAVDTIIYDFTRTVGGHYDPETGETVLDDDAEEDVLARIVIAVLLRGGVIVPVREDEVTADIWNGLALAHLRHPLARAAA